MSIKIYRAYKLVNPNNFWKVTAKIKDNATINTKKVISKLYDDLDIESIDRLSNIYTQETSNHKYDHDWIARRFAKSKYVYAMYKDQATNPYRNEFNLNVEFTVRKYKNNLYLIPYSDLIVRSVFDFLYKAKYVTDFTYWNNTDAPSKMSVTEWKQRGRVWEALSAPERWKNYALFQVLSVDNFYQVDPLFSDIENYKKTYTCEK